ncbi:hypothetical protein [Hydrogenophaga pseudoflava]|uniref:hypothetical protein n=1 Tax=Hydrogenophaga pseudoflava TaxID=47421 RepID=UPI0027E4E122|nr:hypothetical protein [Hydrogenophaga pseudoflava]MDQ7746898.1 hypothetical protein [Hydrogenophaga pseudoflava]
MKRTYARRPLRRLLEAGVRDVAPTYGKRSFATHSDKAGGLVAPESQAERIVAHMLSIDPSVASFKTQPFTVDIVDRRILRTREEVAEARVRHCFRDGDVFYTPDFEIQLANRCSEALEVKLEAFEGDGYYQFKLQEARSVLHGFGYRLRRIVLPNNRAHPAYVNVQLLKRAAGFRFQPLELLASDAVESAQQKGAVTLGDFGKELGVPPHAMTQLLVRGYLSAELLKTRICWSMSAQPAYGCLEHLQLIGGFES